MLNARVFGGCPVILCLAQCESIFPSLAHRLLFNRLLTLHYAAPTRRVCDTAVSGSLCSEIPRMSYSEASSSDNTHILWPLGLAMLSKVLSSYAYTKIY